MQGPLTPYSDTGEGHQPSPSSSSSATSGKPDARQREAAVEGLISLSQLPPLRKRKLPLSPSASDRRAAAASGSTARRGPFGGGRTSLLPASRATSTQLTSSSSFDLPASSRCEPLAGPSVPPLPHGAPPLQQKLLLPRARSTIEGGPSRAVGECAFSGLPPPPLGGHLSFSPILNPRPAAVAPCLLPSAAAAAAAACMSPAASSGEEDLTTTAAAAGVDTTKRPPPLEASSVHSRPASASNSFTIAATTTTTVTPASAAAAAAALPPPPTTVTVIPAKGYRWPLAHHPETEVEEEEEGGEEEKDNGEEEEEEEEAPRLHSAAMQMADAKATTSSSSSSAAAATAAAKSPHHHQNGRGASRLSVQTLLESSGGEAEERERQAVARCLDLGVERNVVEALSTAGVSAQRIVELIVSEDKQQREGIIRGTGLSKNYIMKLQRRALRTSAHLQLPDPLAHTFSSGLVLHVLFDSHDRALFIKKELCRLLNMKGTTFSYWKKKAGVADIDTSQDFRLMDKCRSIFGGRSTYTLYSAGQMLTILECMQRSRQKNCFTHVVELTTLVTAYHSHSPPVELPSATTDTTQAEAVLSSATPR